MAGNLSNYAENKLLDHITGTAAYAMPTVYIALFTSDPNETSSGTEVSGGAYVRLAAAGKFAAATNGSITTSADLEWPTATNNWGTVRSVALMDAPTGGNVLVYGNAATFKVIETGDTYRIAAGNLNIVMD